MLKKILFLIIVLGITCLGAITPHFMKDPSISPDGKTVCFSYYSDLWIVPFTGGEAKRITVSEGNDWNPVFSSDGKEIAFNTNRDGWTCIYIIPAGGGIARPVSKEDFQVIDWFPDGKNLLVKGSEPGFRNKFLKLNLNGSFSELTPFGGNNASISSNGKKIIFDRRGMVYREAYSGSFNGDIWEYDITLDEFTRLTQTDLTEQYPVYSKINDNIYLAASDGNLFQLYLVNDKNFENKKQLTKYDSWSVRKISIARENDRMVFEKFNEIWKFDPESNKTKKLDIEIKQDFMDNLITKEDVKNKADKYAISPDGKLIVFSYKFDLFAIPEKGGEERQITFDQKGIKDIVVLNDNLTIIYSSYVKGKPQLFKVNIKDISDIEKIEWSKDKYIESMEYEQNKLIVNFSDDKRQHQIAVGDSIGNNIKTIIDDQFILDEASISEDGNYMLYIETRQEVWSRHIFVYDFEKGTKELIYKFDGHLDNIFFGKDNKSAFFTENKKICKIDLQARKDFYTEKDHWESILNPDKESGKDKEEDVSENESNKKIAIDFENIAQRIHKIITKTGTNYVVHVLNDSILYYINEFENKRNLRKANYYGENDKRIHTFSKRPENIQYNSKNKSFYFIESNCLSKLNPKSKKKTIVKNNFKYEYNRLELNKDIFDQVWVEFGKGFYDPDMHGVDWEKAFKFYSKYLQYAYTSENLKSIVYEMLGDVNASHTGFYPRDESNLKKYSHAYCGFILDEKDFPKNGIRIKKVFRKSKLYKPHDVKEGDILISIDGNEIGKGMDISKHFKDRVGEKIQLEISCGDTIKEVTIKGLSSRENYALYYDNWVRKE